MDDEIERLRAEWEERRLAARPICTGCERPIEPSNEMWVWRGSDKIPWHRGCWLDAHEG